MAYRYYTNCVNWPRHDVHVEGGLCDMIQAGRSITRRTFMSHVNRDDLRQLEAQLGCAAHPKHGLTMAADWHVSYHRSKLHGKTVYYFKHSGIEFVFTQP